MITLARLRLGWLAFVVLLLPLPAAAWQQTEWSTDYGPMTLQYEGDRVTGVYPDHKGWLEGSVTRDGVLEGIWAQPTSGQACAYAVLGSLYWGTFQFWPVSDTRFEGQWAYCDAAPGSGGSWSGNLTAAR